MANENNELKIGGLLFGEDDFRGKIDTLVKPWLEKCVKDDYFMTTDGAKMHYHFAVPKDAKAIIVMSHGFCEFYGKYHEMTYYFYQMGYGFFFIEHRGHGFSARTLHEWDRVYIDSYDTYVQDFKEFIRLVVDENEDAKGLPRILYSHSMGGAIASLYLEENPDHDFKAAVLSTPMLEMKTGNVPHWEVNALVVVSTILKWDRRFVPGQTEFTGKRDFEHSSMLSKTRYDYVFDQRDEILQYRTWGGTYAWTRASLRATKKLQKSLDKITLPVKLFQAGKDSMVEPSGHDKLREAARDVSFSVYPNSKHEIFHSTDADREKYYQELFAFFEKYAR